MDLGLFIDPSIQRANRQGNPDTRRRYFRRRNKNLIPRPVIVCFRDYADVEAIVANAYKLANKNIGVSRDYPKEIIDARSEFKLL